MNGLAWFAFFIAGLFLLAGGIMLVDIIFQIIELTK